MFFFPSWLTNHFVFMSNMTLPCLDYTEMNIQYILVMVIH